MVEFFRPRILLGIGIIHAVDARRLEEHVGVDLAGPERGAGVGGKIWVAGAGDENDAAALFEVSDRASPDEVLGHLMHLDGGLDPGHDADFLEGILERQSIDDRGQHSHGVARGPVDRAAALAAPDVAAADHDGELDFETGDLADLLDNVLEVPRIDRLASRARKTLPAQLQDDALVAGAHGGFFYTKSPVRRLVFFSPSIRLQSLHPTERPQTAE